MDDGVAAMLQTLDDAFPAVERMSADAARAAVAARRQPGPTSTTPAPRTGSSTPGPVPSPSGSTDRTGPHRGPAGGGVLHGGGFVICDIDSHDGFCRAMSRHTGTVVVSVGLPARTGAPCACGRAGRYAAFGWVMTHADELGIDPRRVRSRGTAQVATWLRSSRCCVVSGTRSADRAGAALPVIDPSFDTDSYRRAPGYVNTRAAMQWYWQHYLAGANCRHRRIWSHRRAPNRMRVYRPRSLSPRVWICCTVRAHRMRDSCGPAKCLWCTATFPDCSTVS